MSYERSVFFHTVNEEQAQHILCIKATTFTRGVSSIALFRPSSRSGYIALQEYNLTNKEHEKYLVKVNADMYEFEDEQFTNLQAIADRHNLRLIHHLPNEVLQSNLLHNINYQDAVALIRRLKNKVILIRQSSEVDCITISYYNYSERKYWHNKYSVDPEGYIHGLHPESRKLKLTSVPGILGEIYKWKSHLLCRNWERIDLSEESLEIFQIAYGDERETGRYCISQPS